MGKKKRGHPDLEELLARPWCYYCERDFDDLKILISHQKAKHFKCERCGRRLNTAGGLSVHMSQVHKEQLSAVDNALPNRSSLDIEIFGMEGVPEDIVQAHNQRVMTQFQQAEMERRAATGNPPPGVSSDNGPAKKPKLEISDLKKRLAEHKAKLAEKASGGSSGDVTPVGAGQTSQAGNGTQTQPPYVSGPPSQQPSYPQPYGSTNSPYQQVASPGLQGVSPNGQHQFNPSQYASPPHYQTGPVGQPPVPYGNVPPILPYVPHQQPNRTHSPPQGVSPYPPRPGSLPVAPGLPQRPAFGAPQVNAQQMQQIHHGHTPPNVPSSGYNAFGYPAPVVENGASSKSVTPGPVSSSVDELISGAAKAADNAAASATAVPQPDTVEEKVSKKEKEKAKTRLVYSDNETSPEEKMAKLPRYAFVPDHRENVALGDATVPAVARATTGPDHVADSAD